MIEKPVYIITFNSSNSSLWLYKLLKDNRLDVYLFQTPCILSAGCSRSIEVSEKEFDKAVKIIKENNAPIGEIYKKYVNENIRRYIYDKITI